jgi:hypothetical protein
LPSFLHSLASPARFQRIAAAVMPWAAILAAGLIGTGVVWGLAFSPPDYQQGDTVRVMYIHVPSAWMAMACYAVMALLSASFLDEGPTWAPNGRVIMFTREEAGSNPMLMSVDISGRNLRRIPTSVAASDPAWSPLLP